MNIQIQDILIELNKKPFFNQRTLAKDIGYSLGMVNKALLSLFNDAYIDKSNEILEKGNKWLEENRPNNAIILAAGVGMRMVPINSETPKALIEVKGEILIERIIRQLKDAGLNNITVVVGFMKESFEYLIDEYGVKLIINTEYSTKNNLHSLWLVKEKINNTYIIPGDIYCEKNPFSSNELYSWYMVTDEKKVNSHIFVNRKRELIKTKSNGNRMIGISYINQESSHIIKEKLDEYHQDLQNDHLFWEDILFDKQKSIVYAKVLPKEYVTEIDTYEQLRDFDENSQSLSTTAIKTAAEVLHVTTDKIQNIKLVKKGMTNRSFDFTCENKKYIMRIPGIGTNDLINREAEKVAYKAITKTGIGDVVIYINPTNGYKIAEYIEHEREANPKDDNDIKLCVNKLLKLHHLKLHSDYTFDIFKTIDYYESLWEGKPSIYRDYKEVRDKIFSLKEIIDNEEKEICLTHIDPVYDNFLIQKDKIYLIDWEYAAMQDPHLDIACFGIYAMYDKKEMDHLIDIYFEEEGGCDKDTRLKIYCYIACMGLLWSNWCEYKRNLGVEFGEYSLRQYRYAKEYYKYVMEEMNV